MDLNRSKHYHIASLCTRQYLKTESNLWFEHILEQNIYWNTDAVFVKRQIPGLERRTVPCNMLWSQIDREYELLTALQHKNITGVPLNHSAGF